MWWLAISNGLAATPAPDTAVYAPGVPTGVVDVYRTDQGAPKGWLVFVHGGSWTSGDKANLARAPGLVSWFAAEGFAVAAPNFRLAGADATWNDQVSDLADAVAFLRRNAAAYGVADRPVVLMGYSSGAHLVALLAADPAPLGASGLSTDALAGVISLDVHAYDVPSALAEMKDSELDQNRRLIEQLFGTTPESQRDASPAHHLHGPMPPSLVVSADAADTPGSKGQIARDTSAAYVRALRAAGHVGEHRHFEDETHGSLVRDFGRPGDGPTAAVSAFLDALPRD